MTNSNADAADHSEGNLDSIFLTFQLDKENYGIAIKYVIEIVGIQPIIKMPEMPDYIKGIISLREKIIPVIDLRVRFNITCKDYDDRTCIIVTDLNGTLTGLVIDNVTEVLKIDSDEIIEKPEMGARSNHEYIKNLAKKDKHIIFLIDCKKLINTEKYSNDTEHIA